MMSAGADETPHAAACSLFLQCLLETLIHCRLNRFSHTIYLKSPISILGISSYEVFVCVEVLRPSQPNGVMSSAVSLPDHTFTGQA